MSNFSQALRTLASEFANSNARSAWNRGVNAYASELVAELAESVENGYADESDLCNERLITKALLNGADDWHQYSDGACALFHDSEIANRLCTPSEFTRTRGGSRRPNAGESWLDVQARALGQAARRVTPRVVDISASI